jgi:Xaa-Pro aminopeptidase
MSWSRFFMDVLAERGIKNGRVGIVGLGDVLRETEGTVAHGTMLALQAALPKVTFENAEDIMHEVRKRKSADEIKALESSQVLADAVRTALRAHARPGVSEGTVYAELHHAYLSAGGELPTMFLFAAESRMWQTHLQPNSQRLLDAQDVLMIEADTKFLGYTAQAVDTVSLRPFTPLERRLFDVSAECFHSILDAMRPGRPYSELLRIWEKTARAGGCLPTRTIGHGLGLGQDGPVTRPSGDAAGMIVEEGDCFVLKPWISDTNDSMSVRVGGLVIVEKALTRRASKMALAPYVVSSGNLK